MTIKQQARVCHLSYDGSMEKQSSAGDAGLMVRRLSHAEARMEQRLYWSGKSIPERLAAMTALNKQMCAMRGIAYDEQEADLTPRRIRRQRS